MGRADYLKLGSNNVICDQCGKKFKAEHVKKQWDGIFACKKCFDFRHPQEFVRGVKDDQTVKINRPEATDVFTPEAQALPTPPFTYGAS